MSAASAWLLAGALWIGCLRPGPWWLAIIGAGALAALAALAHRREGSAARGAAAPGSPRWGQRWLALAAAALMLTGAGLAGARATLREEGRLAALAAEEAAVRVHGVVATESRRAGDGRWLLVTVREVAGVGTRERALVRLPADAAAPPLGTPVRAVGRVRPLGDGGFAEHLRRLHTAARLETAALEPTGDPGWLLRATNRVRARTRAAVRRRYDGDRAALLTGLVLGDTTGRSPERAEAFAAAGLSHLVVVSGRHVAILLGGVLAAAGALGLGARGRRRVGIAAVVWYALLTRWQPSVLRAGTMAGIVLAAGLRGRQVDARHTLAMAALLVLLADPGLAGHIGFALSVTAAGGVLVAAPAIGDRLPGPRLLTHTLAAAIGAQAGAAPVLLLGLDGLPLGAVPANLLAVPAAALAQTVGIVAGVLAQASLGLGGLAAAPAGPALDVVIWTAETFSAGPTLRAAQLAEHAAVMAALAGGGALTVWAARRRGRAAALRWGAVALGAVAVATLWPLRPPAPVDVLTLTALDVGQGDALLVEAPRPRGGTARLLVDAGPDPHRALRALRRRRIRRLDVVALTHPHDDHSGGLPAVLRGREVGRLLVGPWAERESGPSAQPAAPGKPKGAAAAPRRAALGLRAAEAAVSARQALRTAREAGMPVHVAANGDRLRLGAATVTVLHPPEGGTRTGEPHDEVVVLTVAASSGRLLLTGDAETRAQRRLLRRPARLRADVLHVPHHGAATNADGFLDAAGAATAVISVGADNPYGHPHGQVLDALAPTPVYRTDRHGAVRITLGARGPQVRTHRGRAAALRGRGRARLGGRRRAPRRPAARAYTPR